MSIYATWLSISDERQVAAELADRGIDHGVIGDDGLVDDLADLPDEMLDAPIVYQGSHVLPSDADRRGGSVEVAAIPNHIERAARAEIPEGALKDWLRLSVHSLASKEWRLREHTSDSYVKGNHATVLLTRRQVARLRNTLAEWLDRPEGEL